MCNDDIIMYLPPRDESRLLFDDDVVYERLQSVSHYSRQNLVAETTQTDGPKVAHGFRICHLRNKCDICMIHLLQ